jgi:iron-sulfur cluster repair protein YtfE (RIC family)
MFPPARIRGSSLRVVRWDMHAVTQVSHEHHALLHDYVERLYALANGLCPDCLDTPGALAEMDELQELEQGLRQNLMPHMEAVEAAVYPTLERIMDDRQVSAPMRHEHDDIRQLFGRFSEIISRRGETFDRYSVLALRRAMLKLHVLLKTHIDEEELYLPILEDRLTPEGEAALGRALDHLAAARL